MKVVVVDDNADVVRFIAGLLAGTCAVYAAGDGDSGLAAVRSHRPDLVLLDIMMPRAGGLALLQAIRAGEEGPAVPVIVLSALADEATCLAALDAGADDFLPKPFNSRELIARVRTHVHMFRMRRAAVEREAGLLREIAQAKNELAFVLEHTSEACFSFDRNLRLTALNDAATGLLGRRASDAIGAELDDFARGLSASNVGQALRRALDTRQAASVEFRRSADGRWYAIRCYPVRDGVIAFGTDISEHKLREERQRQAQVELEAQVEARTRQLRTAHGLLEAVFDRAPSGIVTTAIDGAYEHGNAAFHALMGYTEAELACLSMRDLTHKGDLAAKQERLDRLLRGEDAHFGMDVRYIRKDGTQFWANIFVSTIADDTGAPRRFIKIVQDISVRKRAEQSAVDSRRALGHLYDRLQGVRDEERTALAREVHDQLGQVLSAAKIDIKLLEDQVRSRAIRLSRDKIVAELRSASGTLDRAIGVVRKIATELRVPEMDGQGLFGALAWHVADFECRTRIACVLAIEPGMAEPAGATATTVFRVYQEAMTNVMRHAGAGRVWICLSRRAGHIVLRVRDDGAGIALKAPRRSPSLGLRGMYERTAIARGRLLIGRAPGGGTLLALRIPDSSAGAGA